MAAPLSLTEWLGTPRARLLLRWERELLGRLWPRFYGHSALAIGSWGEHLPIFPPRWRVETVGHEAGLHCGALSDLRHLPLLDASADLVILRHSLAFAPSPHQLLREADRVLSRRGQLLILNVAPWSIWGLGSRLPWRPMQLPQPMRLLGANRLADWLNLLDFRIEEAGSYGQALPEWTRRLRLGGVLRPGYYIHARKRRLPVRPLRSRWRAPAPAFGQVAMPPARSAARVISFPDTRT